MSPCAGTFAKVAALWMACWLAVPQVFAQQPKVWRIGYLSAEEAPASPEAGRYGVFRRAMRELGYIEGKNVHYEWRFTRGSFDDLPKLAGELVAVPVDVLLTAGTPPTRAAQRATRTIPIVMVSTGDPVGSGLVASLARPGANITGISNSNVQLNGKRVELLATAVPKLSRMAALLNPGNPTYAANLAELQAAAKKARITLVPMQARSLEEVEHAIGGMRQQGVQALVVHTDALFTSNAGRVGELLLKHRLPAVAARELVHTGALMSYSPSSAAAFQRAAVYVDKILKGAKPADLPVEQATKLDLVVSQKTAAALGLALPRELTLLAEQVIQ